MSRDAYSKRSICEDSISIDVRRWHRDGLLWTGRTFSWSWTRRGQPAGSIEFAPANDAVVLLFSWRASKKNSGNPSSSACRSGGRRAISAARVRGFCARRMPETASAAQGASRNCTRAATSSRAASAVGWPTRANARIRGIELSANRRRSGCGSAAHRASSNSSRTSRPGCIGVPMVGYLTRPRQRRSSGWP